MALEVGGRGGDEAPAASSTTTCAGVQPDRPPTDPDASSACRKAWDMNGLNRSPSASATERPAGLAQASHAVAPTAEIDGMTRAVKVDVIGGGRSDEAARRILAHCASWSRRGGRKCKSRGRKSKRRGRKSKSGGRKSKRDREPTIDSFQILRADLKANRPVDPLTRRDSPPSRPGPQSHCLEHRPQYHVLRIIANNCRAFSSALFLEFDDHAEIAGLRLSVRNPEAFGRQSAAQQLANRSGATGRQTSVDPCEAVSGVPGCAVGP